MVLVKNHMCGLLGSAYLKSFYFIFFFMFCFLCLRHNLILLVGGRGSSWDTCQTLQFVAGSCNQRCPCWIPCGSVRQQSVNASLGGYEGVSCCCHRPGSSKVFGGSAHPLGPYLSCQAILRGISGAVALAARWRDALCKWWFFTPVGARAVPWAHGSHTERWSSRASSAAGGSHFTSSNL